MDKSGSVVDYNLNERLKPPADEDSFEASAIEISFAIPVHVTPEQWRRIREVVQEIVDAPCNTPKEGLHWLSTEGVKPQWSQYDARFMGKPVDPNAPLEGEPTYDYSTHVMESSARGFVTSEERERTLRERA